MSEAHQQRQRILLAAQIAYAYVNHRSGSLDWIGYTAGVRLDERAAHFRYAWHWGPRRKKAA